MTVKHQTPLNKLLDARGINGKELARRLDKSEARVSDWRRGLIPGEVTRQQVYAELNLTAQEIADLGWEKETANA